MSTSTLTTVTTMYREMAGASGWRGQGRSHKLLIESGEPEEATMAGQGNLHIALEIFAGWNAHDEEGVIF